MLDYDAHLEAAESIKKIEAEMNKLFNILNTNITKKEMKKYSAIRNKIMGLKSHLDNKLYIDHNEIYKRSESLYYKPQNKATRI